MRKSFLFVFAWVCMDHTVLVYGCILYYSNINIIIIFRWFNCDKNTKEIY